MKEKVNSIKENAIKEIKAADTLQSLNDLRVM